MGHTRRVFLGLVVAATAGWRPAAARQGGLEAFATSEAACAADARVTPSVPADTHYRPGAPLRASLISVDRLREAFQLTGLVAGVTCGPIPNADIEFWQADGRGAYDATGFAFRGRQQTDAGGRYTLTTLVPGATAGRAPCLGVRIVADTRAELWTVLFFPGRRENARDPRFTDALLITRESAVGGRFDFRLPI
jgi:protocatechuate 3,4-dioxygenase beta subunit